MLTLTRNLLTMALRKDRYYDLFIFTLYINDLENSVNNTPRLFADDTCLIANSSCILELEQHLNMELNNIAS